MQELKSGMPSGKEKNVSFRVALEDPDTRVDYIRRKCCERHSHPYSQSIDLQQLQAVTEGFLKKIIGSTHKMPYSMRYLARETLLTLRVNFPFCFRLPV